MNATETCLIFKALLSSLVFSLNTKKCYALSFSFNSLCRFYWLANAKLLRGKKLLKRQNGVSLNFPQYKVCLVSHLKINNRKVMPDRRSLVYDAHHIDIFKVIFKSCWLVVNQLSLERRQCKWENRDTCFFIRLWSSWFKSWSRVFGCRLVTTTMP